MVEVHHEDEFSRVSEDKYWYIVEDKTLMNREVVHTGETRTGMEMRIEFVQVGNEMKIRKVFLPKDKGHIQLALNMGTRISGLRKREKERLMELYGR